MAHKTRDRQAEQDRMSANLQKGIELTELALALRLAAMQQNNPAATMVDVMHEIRLAKEAAWRRMAEEEARRNSEPQQ
ncbi:hypothetical protein [Nitrospira moscoviensis]|uniref:Uncharacterized protein n=1 Tax=Nitrospira moscoviensis TaxID=42253 RepID=A0A0K2GGB7_NITMO|nr:hypothetical protein [Nitrospira moscoviensis]ALA59981.1 hypothetical protein NITMOv2_3589 [Nitrospira moscoviensis]